MGTAFLTGFDNGFTQARQGQQRKQQLSDEERAAGAAMLRQNILGMQQNLGKLNPNDPKDAQQYQTLQAQIAKSNSDLTGLFHPSTGPGAMAQLGKFVSMHLHPDAHQAQPSATMISSDTQLPGQQMTSSSPGIAATPARSALPATTGDPGLPAQAVNMGIAAGPTIPAAPSVTATLARQTPATLKSALNDRLAEYATAAAPIYVNPILQKKQQRIEAGMSPAEADEAAKVDAGLVAKASSSKGLKPYGKPYLKDGKYYATTFNAETGEYESQEMPEGWSPPAGTGAKVGSFGDFMEAAYGPRPTAEQYAQGRSQWAKAAAGVTESERTVFLQQKDGSYLPVTVESTSQKAFPGGGGGGVPSGPRADDPDSASPQTPGSPALASPPKTSGEAKKRVASTAPKQPKSAGGAGVVHVGKPIEGKQTPQEIKAANDVVAATKLASVADQALQAKSAGLDKELVGSLQKDIEGRFNQSAYDNLRANYGTVNALRQWLQDKQSGALTDQARAELVAAAHANLKAAQDGLAAAKQSTSSNDEDDDESFLKKVK